MDKEQIIDGIRNGSRRMLAKAISIVENHQEGKEQILKSLNSACSEALRVGVTGFPGAGKSSLVDCLIDRFRRSGQKVGVVSVDPTSPFSGGAILGDRVRMTRYYNDDSVFIRSMATRGGLGGLAQTSLEVADLIDAAGFKVIIFETVGVGQIELDIINAADVVVVVLVPESGDDIQTMKSGLMEIADLFVVNKSDRKNAEQMSMYIRSYLELVKEKLIWVPPVINTVATENKGIDELYSEIDKFVEFSRKTGLYQKRRRLHTEDRIKRYIEQRLEKEFWTSERRDALSGLLANHNELNLSIYEIGEKLIKMK